MTIVNNIAVSLSKHWKMDGGHLLMLKANEGTLLLISHVCYYHAIVQIHSVLGGHVGCEINLDIFVSSQKQ